MVAMKWLCCLVCVNENDYVFLDLAKCGLHYYSIHSFYNGILWEKMGRMNRYINNSLKCKDTYRTADNTCYIRPKIELNFNSCITN